MCKQLLILFLINFFVVGNLQPVYEFYYNWEPAGQYDEKNTLQATSMKQTKPTETINSTPALGTTHPFVTNKDTQCPANKSLHTEEDIRVLIDYIYEKLEIDEILQKAYERQLANMRDIFVEDLEKFVKWFHHQPEHLKHILDGLTRVRVQYMEPKINIIAKMFEIYPALENKFKDNLSRFHKLEQTLKKYKALCSFNCESNEEHKVFKREIDSKKYYCSSLAELYDKIEKKLTDSTVQMKTNLTNQLSIDNENYKDNIDKIKNHLKDKALVSFGRTMYEVLILEDDYYHYLDELNATAVETDIYSLRNLFIKIDDKLLELHRAVEKYGDHCRKCGNVFMSAVRMSNVNNEELIDESLAIVDTLIDSEFNKIEIQIANDWKEILNHLNELIIQIEKDNSVDDLKPIQEEVLNIINNEREEMKRLKEIASETQVNNVMNLILKSQDLIKEIDVTIHSVASLLK